MNFNAKSFCSEAKLTLKNIERIKQVAIKMYNLGYAINNCKIKKIKGLKSVKKESILLWQTFNTPSEA
jgi:hypothetical protein